MELNSNGVNKAIVAHILSEKIMRGIGFTDNMPDRWYYCRILVSDKFGGISFNVTIPKDGSDLDIEVLDEAFCQPYDYQFIRNADPSAEFAKNVFEKVEEEMKYLQDAGVLSGHNYGEYI